MTPVDAGDRTEPSETDQCSNTIMRFRGTLNFNISMLGVLSSLVQNFQLYTLKPRYLETGEVITCQLGREKVPVVFLKTPLSLLDALELRPLGGPTMQGLQVDEKVGVVTPDVAFSIRIHFLPFSLTRVNNKFWELRYWRPGGI